MYTNEYSFTKLNGKGNKFDVKKYGTFKEDKLIEGVRIIGDKVLEGTFNEQEQLNGKGIMLDKAANIIYKGEFLKDKLEGDDNE